MGLRVGGRWGVEVPSVASESNVVEPNFQVRPSMYLAKLSDFISTIVQSPCACTAMVETKPMSHTRQDWKALEVTGSGANDGLDHIGDSKKKRRSSFFINIYNL